MAQTVTLNGVDYQIPDVGEIGWGEEVSNYLIALSTGVLTKTGGLFALQSDLDFGASYGVAARYFRSRSGAASAGLLRLAASDGIYWRSADNTTNLGLTVNPAGQLVFNGQILAVAETPWAQDVQVVPVGNLTATNVQDALEELQGDIDVINTTGSPALAAHIADTTTHGTTGDIVGTSDTQTLTNKTISGSSNTITNIPLSALPYQDVDYDPNTLVARDSTGSIIANGATFMGDVIVAAALEVSGDPVLTTASADTAATPDTIARRTGTGALNATTFFGTSVFVTGSVQGSAFFGNGVTSSTGNALTLTSGMVAGDANSSFVMTTTSSRTNGRLLTLRNNSVENFYVDFDGAVTFNSNIAGASGKSGFAVNVPTLQTNAAARPFVVRYVGTDFMYLNRDGTFITAGSAQIGGSVTTSNVYGASTAQPLGFNGSVNNSSTAVATTVVSQVPLTTAGAKITSFRNGATEKLAVDKDGNLLFQTSGLLSYFPGSFYMNADLDVSNGLDGYVSADSIIGYGDGGGNAATFMADVDISGGDLYMNGRSINTVAAFNGSATVPFLFTSNLGATSTTPDITLNTTINRTAANGKFLSLRNFSTERMYIMTTGNVAAPEFRGFNAAPATIKGYQADSSTAVGVITDTSTNYATAGDKLVSFRNNGVEKAYIDNAGNYIAGGGSAFLAAPAAGNQTLDSRYGTATFGVGSASITITNNRIINPAQAVVLVSISDTTANTGLTQIARVSYAAGSFTIWGNAPALLSQVNVRWFVAYGGA